MKFVQFKLVLTATAIAAGLCSAAVHAEPYAGASIGAPRYEGRIQGSDGHGSGVSGKVFGGYQITPNVSVEAGYADLGQVGGDAGKTKARGEYLDAVGQAPINAQWALLGRVGVAHVDVESPVGDSSGNGLKLGAGAQYTVAKNIAVRGEWERYRPEEFGSRTSIDQFMVGLRYGF